MAQYKIELKYLDGYVVVDAKNETDAKRKIKQMFRKVVRRDDDISSDIILKIKIQSIESHT